MYDNSGVDVTAEPFCAEFTDKGIRNSNGYVENSGYSMQTLRSLLYVLCATEPGTFYLGAIRETDRRSPEIKVFNECCVFFPYFDNQKRFHVVIYKDGNAVSFDEFYSRYYRDFISLVKVQATEEFYPSDY